jgi:hypothetical protein
MAHKFLTDRKVKNVWIVMRLDDYKTTYATRGQIYTEMPRTDDANKALWTTEAAAMAAAKWAADKFGHLYGVFKCVSFIEQTKLPIKVTRIRS